jgi:hypothetical protein
VSSAGHEFWVGWTVWVMRSSTRVACACVTHHPATYVTTLTTVKKLRIVILGFDREWP